MKVLNAKSGVHLRLLVVAGVPVALAGVHFLTHFMWMEWFGNPENFEYVPAASEFVILLGLACAGGLTFIGGLALKAMGEWVLNGDLGRKR